MYITNAFPVTFLTNAGPYGLTLLSQALTCEPFQYAALFKSCLAVSRLCCKYCNNNALFASFSPFLL